MKTLGGDPLAGVICLDGSELRGRRVLVRLDLNVPIANGRVLDDHRIQAAVPTLRKLRDRGADVTVACHLGELCGRFDPAYRIEPIRRRLTSLVGEVRVLENLRFQRGEVENAPHFAASLARDQELFVNDAFSVSHRPHASVVGVPRLLPAVAGPLLTREVRALQHALPSSDVGLLCLGGAKLSDKLAILTRLGPRVETVAVGGAIALPFLAAVGRPVGRPAVDAAQIRLCERLLTSLPIVLPDDFVIRRDRKTMISDSPPSDASVIDIGPRTTARISKLILSARHVLWNGPMGVIERREGSQGTEAIARAVSSTTAVTTVGGGHTVSTLQKHGLNSSVDHVSTGGGAMLAFLAHGDLPGLAALRSASAGLWAGSMA